MTDGREFFMEERRHARHDVGHLDAKCSVLVGRRRDEERGEKNGSTARIIIGLDGSESSDQVIRAVAARTWHGGSLASFVPPPIETRNDFSHAHQTYIFLLE